MSECEEKCPTISFLAGNDDKNWIMKLTREKGKVSIRFNRDKYPDACPDDFANAVVAILENCYPNVSWEPNDE